MRFTGKLEIGRPKYEAGVFSVPMVYVNHHSVINDDDARSCELAVRQQFLQLLHINRFHEYGTPEVEVDKVSNHMLSIVVSTPAKRKMPAPIVIQSMKPDEPAEG